MELIALGVKMYHHQFVSPEMELNHLISENGTSVQDVIEHLCNLNLRDQIEFESCQSPLVAAVEVDRKDLLTLMIEEFGLNVNSTVKNSGDYWCALAAAIIKKDEEMVQFLVKDMEADVNILRHSSTYGDDDFNQLTYIYMQSTCSLLQWTMNYEMR